MKVVEPISSALLITGCIYAAGTSQNSAFMRGFGISPEFSQPSVDKILYDGGLITFELFYNHLKLALMLSLVLALVVGVVWLVLRFIRSGCYLAGFYRRLARVFYICTQAPIGFFLLLYITFLCFSSYEKSQDIGVKLAETFMERCHRVVMKDKQGDIPACAFRKDKDSIWYYVIVNGDADVKSRLLTDLVQVTYLEPVDNVLSSESVK